jgi:hypothetical protein
MWNSPKRMDDDKVRMFMVKLQKKNKNRIDLQNKKRQVKLHHEFSLKNWTEWDVRMEIGNAYDIPSPPFDVYTVWKNTKLGNRESDVSRTVPELFDIINYALYYLLLLYALLLNHNFLITL